MSEKGESLRSRGQARVVGELLTPDAYFFPKKNLESTPERTETPLSRGTTYTHRRSALRQKESTMPQIQYSEKYYDDIYEYRCVCETSRSPTTLFFYTAGCGKETKKKKIRGWGGARDVCLAANQKITREGFSFERRTGGANATTSWGFQRRDTHDSLLLDPHMSSEMSFQHPRDGVRRGFLRLFWYRKSK